MYNIAVQFPGTPKEYAYVSAAEPVLGQRVVVPTSIKKDGTVSLSIATIVGFSIDVGYSGKVEPHLELKPIIALLDPVLIAAAQEFVLKLEVPAV
jgi:hypothetical protein